MSKPYTKSYNIIQYIRTDEYTTFAKLSKKTNTSVETLKKQLAFLKIQFENVGYSIETSKKGIKLVKGDSDYLPVDLILFNSSKYDFIQIFIKFISEGLTEHDIFYRMYSEMFYTQRQVQYFFKTHLNLTLNEFKKKSNFEYFSIFVEYCTLWFNCRNIKKLFDEYLKIDEYNKLMLTYPECQNISPNDYLTVYSVLVFRKINISEISEEYSLIEYYFQNKQFTKGLNYYKKVIKYTQNAYLNDAMINYYLKINDIKNISFCLDEMYKNFNLIAFELEFLQREITSRTLSYKTFDFTLIYEVCEDNLAIIKGALKKNYPNINIICIPSWIYLYGKVEIRGIVYSNTIINYDINVIEPRDSKGNYNLDLSV